MIYMSKQIKKKILPLGMITCIGLSTLTNPVTAIATENTTAQTQSQSNDDNLTTEQKNSLAMLNHLVVLSDEINTAQNNRLYLEEVYSSIVSNTYPNAVDSETLSYLNALRSTIEKYRMIDEKRERLELINEKKQAQAIKDAVPNPVGLLSAVAAGDPIKALASVVYMAVDAGTGYTSAKEEADLEYLQAGWELDDAAKQALEKNRSNSFDYLVSIVNQYDIPGEYSLSEDAIKKFAKKYNDSNTASKVQYFEDNEKIYRGYAGYWKALAECYYELAKNSDDKGFYQKCLNSIKKYEEVQTKIFRKDHDLAHMLPMGIVAAEHLYSGNQYICIAEDYIEKIKNNIEDEDWTLRYFVAQTEIDLYRRNPKQEYLDDAYKLIRTSVNILAKEQQEMNMAYLKDVQLMTIDKKKDKAQVQNDKKEYNKLVKEGRKTELAPIYEPLQVNCELLYALADKAKISSSERVWINQVLHPNGDELFLIAPLDNKYWFDTKVAPVEKPTITYDGDQLNIPASYVSGKSEIIVTVDGTEYSNWTIKEVKRNKSNTIADFVAIYNCADLKKHKFESDNGKEIKVSIKSVGDNVTEEYVYLYKAKVTKKLKVLNDVEFVLQ